MPEKISLDQIKKLPPEFFLSLINKAKRYLKKNQVFIDLCKEYQVEPSIIDLLPIKFDKLDVSAKTLKGIVILNYKLLEDGDFFKDYSYLIHEITHVFQQTLNKKPTQSSDDGSYLDNKYEQESFQNQVEYIAEEFGGSEAEDYVENLLHHHEVDDKKEKEEKKELFLAKV